MEEGVVGTSTCSGPLMSAVVFHPHCQEVAGQKGLDVGV